MYVKSSTKLALALVVLTSCQHKARLRLISPQNRDAVSDCQQRLKRSRDRLKTVDERFSSGLAAATERWSSADRAERNLVAAPATAGQNAARREQYAQEKAAAIETWAGTAQHTIADLTGYYEEVQKIVREAEIDVRRHARTKAERESERVFFEDILRRYAEVWDHLPIRIVPDVMTSIRASGTIDVRLVSEFRESLVSLINVDSVVGDALIQVATRRVVTFNLRVESTPPGAEIHYGRRGDPLRLNNRNTDTIIPNLPIAVWIVKVSMPGYKDVTIEHDALREIEHTERPRLQVAMQGTTVRPTDKTGF